MAAQNTHVLIAGAGIGGLCAAIALRRRGFQVTVLEKQPSPREVGAGLGLWVNAVRALGHLGVKDLLDDIAVPDATGGIFDDQGRALATMSSTAFEQRFGSSTAIVHRPEFLRGLAARCDATIRGNAEVATFRQTPDRVTVTLTDGGHVEGDLLIGADGIRSSGAGVARLSLHAALQRHRGLSRRGQLVRYRLGNRRSFLGHLSRARSAGGLCPGVERSRVLVRECEWPAGRPAGPWRSP
jgi:2-polyprenyl-6-methoxyphenol hydroxylase-like FAD-dependent oxidoreductase